MRIVSVFLVWTFSFQIVFAENYIREYTYKASEADSKLSSRTIALDQVKKLLLQEIGTHIRQKINITKDGSGSTYASEDVEAITAGFTKVDILEEKWDGETYYLKAKIEADTKRVLNALESFKKVRTEENKQQLEILKANQRLLDSSRKEITQLKRQLKEAKNETQKQEVIAKYIEEVEQISIFEMFDRGFENSESGQYEDAFYWYKKAAEQGHVIAQNNLALAYAEGQGVKKDNFQAVAWVRKAAEQGYPLAQLNLGVMYAFGRGVQKDVDEALNWFRKAADQGFAKAQHELGVRYFYGKGVQQDISQALKWYRKAAEQGFAEAQLSLGLIYYKGLGVKQNHQKAGEWILKAAEQGDSATQLLLGSMYSEGAGLKQDSRRAAAWYLKAAMAGQPEAQYNLAILYEKGEGVELDQHQAVDWYRKAAKQEHAKAQYNLGFKYAFGEGVKQDMKTAKYLFGKSCEGGFQEGCDNYKIFNMNGR